jgi:hypothetical protein
MSKASDKLREAVAGVLNLDDGDPVWLALLEQACAAADGVAALESLVASDGIVTPGSRGQVVIHPAVPELRQARAALAKLLLQLGVSDEQLRQSVYARRVRKAGTK